MDQDMANMLAKVAEAFGFAPMTPPDALTFFTRLESALERGRVSGLFPVEPAFVRCQKATPTEARQLTQADYEQRMGIIHTHEGAAAFATGDFLARDHLGEYPIRQSSMESCYRRVSEPDAEGWARYQSKEIRFAVPMPGAFTIHGLSGQTGDYLVFSDDHTHCWPCARAKFEAEYHVLSLN